MMPVEYKRRAEWHYFHPETVQAYSDLRQMFADARPYRGETWSQLMNLDAELTS